MTREEQIKKEARLYDDPYTEACDYRSFADGAKWADEHPKPLWKDAQGEDLPPIDKEVVVIDKQGKVSFGHRPDKKHGYLGKSLLTNNIETFYPHTYDKGEWNIPDIVWWLDLPLPEEKGGKE